MVIPIFKYMGCFSVKQVIKVFVVHACKIVDFTGTHINYGFFCYLYFNWFLMRFFCFFKTGGHVIAILYSFRTCLIFWILVGRRGCSLNTDISTTTMNLPVPLIQQLFQASCFYCYLLVTSV